MDRLGRGPYQAGGAGLDILRSSGANLQLGVPLWDLTPDNGGAPVKFVVPSVDANEFVERNPQRFIFATIDEQVPPEGAL